MMRRTTIPVGSDNSIQSSESVRNSDSDERTKSARQVGFESMADDSRDDRIHSSRSSRKNDSHRALDCSKKVKRKLLESQHMARNETANEHQTAASSKPKSVHLVHARYSTTDQEDRRAFPRCDDKAHEVHSLPSNAKGFFPSTAKCEKKRQDIYKMAANASLVAYYDSQKQREAMSKGEKHDQNGLDGDASNSSDSTRTEQDPAAKPTKFSTRVTETHEDSTSRWRTNSGKLISAHHEQSSLADSECTDSGREDSQEEDSNQNLEPSSKKTRLATEKSQFSDMLVSSAEVRRAPSDRFDKGQSTKDQSWIGSEKSARQHVAKASSAFPTDEQLQQQLGGSRSIPYLLRPDLLKNTDHLLLQQGFHLSAPSILGSSPSPGGLLLGLPTAAASVGNAPFTSLLPSLTSDQLLRSLTSAGDRSVAPFFNAADVAILSSGNPASYPASLQQIAQLQSLNASLAEVHARQSSREFNSSLIQGRLSSADESVPAFARSSSAGDCVPHHAMNLGNLEMERQSSVRDSQRRNISSQDLFSSVAGTRSLNNNRWGDIASKEARQGNRSDSFSASGIVANPLDGKATLLRMPLHSSSADSHPLHQSLPSTGLAFTGRELIPLTTRFSQLLPLPGGRISTDVALGAAFPSALAPFATQVSRPHIGASLWDASIGEVQNYFSFGTTSRNTLHEAANVSKNETDRTRITENFASASDNSFGNSLLGKDHRQQGTIECSGIPLTLPIVLGRPDDKHKLSNHQVLLRYQIEAFQASNDDVSTHTRGRNRPITLGQVGIRCKHCAHLPVAARQKGSTYFPATLLGLYQAAQNMSTTHMQGGVCHDMPAEIKEQFAAIMSTAIGSSGAGRPYWARSARQLGLVDTEEHGIRFIRDLPPNAKRSDGLTF